MPDFRIATHTNRKTYYLLAVWGGGCASELLSSEVRLGARHKTMENALKYSMDANALLNLAKSSGWDINTIIFPYKPIRIIQVGLARSITATCTSEAKKFWPIHKLARHYIEKVGRMNRQNVNYSISSVLDAVYVTKRVSCSISVYCLGCVIFKVNSRGAR